MLFLNIKNYIYSADNSVTLRSKGIIFTFFKAASTLLLQTG